MKILAIDDERPALNILGRAILEAAPDAEFRDFTRASEAVAEIRDRGYQPDVAFLDIEMPGITGLELAATLKRLQPKVNIVFVTGFSQYALDAMMLHPSGYLMKPATAEKVRSELDNLRYPPKLESTHRIRIQCFGNFEIFADGQPVSFTYQKSKELLAYLVDRRGAACNTSELCAVLWEDRPDSAEVRKYLRKLLSDLTHSLSAVGAEDIFVKSRNRFAIASDKVDCDYYGMLKHDLTAINTYFGEYMTQYSWSEMTLGSIESTR